MTGDQLRTLIRGRIDDLNITTHHAARIADIPDQTVRDYLGGADLRTRQALQLAAAIGLAVSAAPVAGFAPPPARPAGRPAETAPKKSSRKSGNRD